MGGIRDLKNRKSFTNSIKPELYTALDELSRDTRIPKSRLLDEAIKLLLAKHGKPLSNDDEKA